MSERCSCPGSSWQHPHGAATIFWFMIFLEDGLQGGDAGLELPGREPAAGPVADDSSSMVKPAAAAGGQLIRAMA